MSDEYLSVSEAAEKLSVSPRTIQRYCKQGRLNYKWVTGMRHRELRIIPPIPVAELPGVKKHGISTDGFITADDFSRTIDSLTEQLHGTVERLNAITREIDCLKTSVHGDDAPQAPTDKAFIEKTGEIIRDYTAVRPVEKKLILKMAKEIQTHARFLRTLGMKDTHLDSDQTE